MSPLSPATRKSLLKSSSKIYLNVYVCSNSIHGKLRRKRNKSFRQQFPTSMKIVPMMLSYYPRANAHVQREATLSQLARHLDSASPSPATSAPSKPAIDPKKGHLARHRQILSQHRSDLAQLRHQLGEKRGRAQLFQSVRRDVDNYRATDPAAAEDEYMIQERGRIDRSNQEADSLLARAHAVNEGMGLQREQLERIRRKALDVAGMVPGVNGLIGRIASKRRRDGIILGSFIAICFLFVWFFS